MDRLTANQSLQTNQELISNSGWFRLKMFPNGQLAIYRTQANLTIWVAPGMSQTGGSAVMQADGNFVAISPQNTPYWSTGSAGHAGALIIMQDDGNLVVYDAANHPLWASNTVQDLLSPTIRYSEGAGYNFDETSESWKKLCQSLPCFLALQWPGYATGIIEDVIDGQNVVIQWWKGWCPKFLGFIGVQSFPGGIGGEVGIYRRIPGKVRPTDFSFLPPPLAALVSSAISNLSDNDLWWPFPELNAEVEYSLTNPVNGQRFFAAGPETSYWLAKWMDESSYVKYEGDQGLKWSALPAWWPGNSNTPVDPSNYVLEFRVNGKMYGPIPATSDLHLLPANLGCVSQAADKLDLFAVAPTGMVRSASWEPTFNDGWHGWETIDTSRFLPHATISAVSRSTDKIDIFGTDLGGNVQTAAWQPDFTDGWHGWWQVAGGSALPGAPVTAVSRAQDFLDIFVVGTDTRVWTAAWQPAFADGWHGWWAIGNAKFIPSAPVTAVSRSLNNLDIFATDAGGAVQTASWQPEFTDGWHGWWPVAGGRAAPGAAVAAVSRAPDTLDIFVVGTDGRVWTATWDPTVSANWSGWSPIGSAIFPAGSLIHAISRSLNKIDIFGTDTRGVVMNAAWESDFTDGWHGWWEIAGGRAMPGTPVSALSRSQDKLDIFVVGTDGRVWTAAWEPGFTGWHGWWSIP